MKVAYIGNFGPDHSTENHYARSLESLGCAVLRLQEDEYQVWGAEELPEFDLLLYTRTWDTVPLQAMQLAAMGTRAPTAAVHLDVWMGLDRAGEVDSQAMFRLDYVFQPDGDAVSWFAERGVNARWLRAGVLGSECYDATPFTREEVPWDVAFVGSRGYHHEWPHRPEVIDFLAETYGDRFVHVGGDGTPILGLQPGEALRGPALNRFYATVPVIVGDSIFSDNPGRNYSSDRFYETWGRGGFLIYPELDHLRDEVGPYPSYRPGEPSWRDTLHQAVENALQAPEARASERARIAAAVRSRCTYAHRAAELLRQVGLEAPSEPADRSAVPSPPAPAPPLPPASSVVDGLMTHGPGPHQAGPPPGPGPRPVPPVAFDERDPNNPASFAPAVLTGPAEDLRFMELRDAAGNVSAVLADTRRPLAHVVGELLVEVGPFHAGDVVVVRVPDTRLGAEGLAVARLLEPLGLQEVGSLVVADDAPVVRVEVARSRSTVVDPNPVTLGS